MASEESQDRKEAEGGEAQAVSPLSSVYPGENVHVAGRDLWVRPWGVKALMTEVPALMGRLMAKLAPMFEMVKGGSLAAEDILQYMMTNSAGEVVEFVAWSVGVKTDEMEALSAGDFVRLARAVIRQNKDFFDQIGGLYADLGQEIVSGLGATGSRSSSPSEGQGSPSTS